MGKTLVIVESPAKAKTINKYLGEDFVVKSSVGHVRDLPRSGSRASSDPKQRAKQAARTRRMSPREKERHRAQKAREQLFKSMGIYPEDDWKADYATLPDKTKVVEDLQRLAKKADSVYLATDMDREGEAIAWHLMEVIGGDSSRYKRVVFNEITKSAIKTAFDAPGELNINRVEAQQARRFLDRLVGFMISPLLWEKVARRLSAGRVQSVALRILVEREREIRAFQPEEYWTIHAELGSTSSDSGRERKNIRFEVTKKLGNVFRPRSEVEADLALEKLMVSAYVVTSREDKPTQSKPPAPFITSTLQQASSTRLGFGVKKTMIMAQKLYEAGYITYMRTDSTNLSADSVTSCREYIGRRYPAEYLPNQPIIYRSKSDAQEAHEAIRPTNIDVLPRNLLDIDKDAVRLYEMIWRQFVACQMAAARYSSTKITVTADEEYELLAKGRVTIFDGYTIIQANKRKNEEQAELPDLVAGDQLELSSLDPQQHFTKPPTRYSEAALVRELEKKGVGRPSTYASIISTIQERGYVRITNKRLFAEKIGDIVTDRLLESFKDLMDYGFTAAMEEKLDKVAAGDLSWKQLLDDFYKNFSEQVENAKNGDRPMRPNQPSMTDIVCDSEGCGRPMSIRTAATGVFLGCSGYTLPPKERCRATKALIAGDEAINIDEDDEAESKLLLSRLRCQICNTSMDAYLVDSNRKLHICGNNPDCEGFLVEKGQYVIKGYDGPVIACDKCGNDMQLKTGRFGKYFGCTGQKEDGTNCKNTRKLLRNGEVAPPKADPIAMPWLQCDKVEDHYVLRDGASGIFLAANQYPKHRETRAPLLSELIDDRIKGQLDPKYHFLLSAPVRDPDGLPSVIRFDRKEKEHYVRSEKNGKPTGWRAVFQDRDWSIVDKRKK